MDTIVINIKEVINTTFCVDVEDGEKINGLVHQALLKKQVVVLSFVEIELVITAFLHSAVGKLYKDFQPEFLESHIRTQDLPREFESVWEKVIEGAPLYYANKEELDKKFTDIIED